jgi:hypothetical protein
MVLVMTFTNTTSRLSQIVTATIFSPVYETSIGVPENRTIVTPQLTRKTIVYFKAKIERGVDIRGCEILPDGKLVFTERVVNRLLMFSNNGNYEKDIVRFSGIPYDVQKGHS